MPTLDQLNRIEAKLRVVDPTWSGLGEVCNDDLMDVMSPTRDRHNFYVYIYFDTRKVGVFEYFPWRFKYEPFYVGKGCDGRLGAKKNKYVENIVGKIESSGNKVIRGKVVEGLTEEQAFRLERFFVNKIGRRLDGSGPLANLTGGGEGFSEPVEKAESKRLRNWRKSVGRRSKERSLEIGQSISDGWWRKPLAEREAIAKRMSKSMKGVKKSAKWHESQRRMKATPEYKAAQSARMKEVHRRKVSEGWTPPPGHQQSEEAKRKIAEKARLRWANPAFRKKMQEARAR